ncbi:MAG: S8 family serine peptidase, partial [Acidobacteriota bacterium]|nr:S8 family serine peptidase [Acidobacteriota bacterium]
EAGVGLDEMYVDDVPATDDPTGLSGEDFHDFGGDDPYAAINLAWNCGITLVLQWNEPFESLGGSGASTDLNLALCTGETPETCSYDVPGPPDRQGCGSGGGTVPKGDAVETTSYFNFSPTADRETVYLAVDRFCSRAGGPLPSDVRFRVVAFGDGCSLGDSEVAADCSTSTRSFCFEAGIFDTFQIYGHAAAEGVVAVGASFYEEIDSGGTVDPPTTQIDVEPFSSLGGDLPFYFTGSGSPLPGAPVTRFKPDVAAPDVVNTSFFGAEDPDPGGSFEGDGFPNFVGTSAAAPHAAAVAALMLDAEPNLTGSGIGKLLTCRARDIESAGPDPLSGFGLVDAVEALAALQPQITLATSAELTNNVGDPTSLDEGDVLTYGYDVTNPNPFPLASVSVTDPHPGLSAITCPGGNPVPQLAENGAAASCTATYTVTAGDVSSGSISNTATATGLACGAASVTGQAMDGMTIPTCILDRVLPETVETGTGVEKTACRTLDSGTSYVIQVGAEVAFRAGGTIILRNGFTVDGTFAAVLDPDLDI